MSDEVSEWLEELEARLASATGSLDIRAFVGTEVELAPALASWKRPPGLKHHAIDISTLTSPANHVADARLAVETALETIAAIDGSGLLVLRGVHLLAWLFPGGPTMPLNRYLRTGRMAVLLVIPPSPTTELPDGAYLADWRTPLLQNANPFQPEPDQVRKGVD